MFWVSLVQLDLKGIIGVLRRFVWNRRDKSYHTRHPPMMFSAGEGGLRGPGVDRPRLEIENRTAGLHLSSGLQSKVKALESPAGLGSL